jgi:hypothetical protein
MVMALRSNASFTKRSVSSRIACFDISRFLAFCTIGHTSGRVPRQRTCWLAIVHDASANQLPSRGPTKPAAARKPRNIRDVNFAHQRLVVALTDDFLDEADKGTPQLGVANLRERSDQFQSVGVCQKVRDVGGPRSLCVLPDAARDLRAPSKKNGTGTCKMQDISCNRLALMRFVPFSYFCTCWKVKRSLSASFP